MPDNGRRETALVWKENMRKIQWKYFQFDPAVTAIPLCGEIWQKVTREFYFYKLTPSQAFYSWKRYRFEKQYKKHPELFPAILNPDTLAIDKLTSAVPGSSLDKNLFIGYFKDLKLPDGRLPPDKFGFPAECWQPSLDAITYRLETLVTGFKLSGGNEDSRLLMLESHLSDLKALSAIFRFVAELFTYAQTESLPQLKTGHIIGLAGGLVNSLDKLEHDLTESGFIMAGNDENEMVFTVIRELSGKIRLVLPFWASDLIMPAITAVNGRLENDNGMPVFIPPARPKQKGLLEKFLDMFLPPLPLETGRFATSETTKPAPALRQAERQTLVNTRPAVSSNDRIINSMPFYNLNQELKKWQDRLRSDLEVIVNPQGQVIQTKQGFDQFDTPERNRDPGTARALLLGKPNSGEAAAYRNSDTLVVKSTYWIFDRITGILENYPVKKEGIRLDTAVHLVEDARSLFTPSKTEYNEIRALGTFPQFQVNMKRLFDSQAMIGRYRNQIHYLEELMVSAENFIKEKQSEAAKAEPAKEPGMKNDAKTSS